MSYDGWAEGPFKPLHEAEFKTIRPALKSLASRQNTVNKFLSDLGKTYHAAIPLDAIFKTLHDNGFDPQQEDGTPWSGLLLGRTSQVKLDLKDQDSGKVNRWLSLSWHKMDVTGNFEVTAYIS